MTSPSASGRVTLGRLAGCALPRRLGRPGRFVLTGATGGAFQLFLLKLLTVHGWPALAANAVAFVFSAQVNFSLSNVFTWGDRAKSQTLWRRWLTFHAAIAGMAVVNLATFTVARNILPDMEAAAAGIAVAAIGNFFLGDRLVFRASPHGAAAPEQAAA